jgi:hypothetical protein
MENEVLKTETHFNRLARAPSKAPSPGHRTGGTTALMIIFRDKAI